MNETFDCPTNPDDDAPASRDHFGVHGRLARTIAQIIDNTPGGKTVGLSGTWGAGKSTVVRLLEQCYHPPNATTVVWTFDAWAHEGDPLRRTFLERLVARLADQGWLASTDWQRDLDVVARRRKWSRRRQAPRLTPIGMLLAMSLLLVPIGSALFGNQLRNGISFDPARGVDWIAVLGLALMLMPLAVPVLGALLWLPVAVMRGAAGARLGQHLLDIAIVFVMRGETDLDTDTLESGDQTTLEFGRLFGDIMRAALDADARRRLVVVIDNLDRVGAAQALAIWSTLQTFLQRAGTDRWSGQVWYLIPFDADAIRRLWQKDGPGTAVAESFLDKTFQLRFEVPLPRLANWKDFLTDRLAHTLPRHAGGDEFFRIYRLYSLRRSADWSAPTPRQLKLFVNQVGSLHWQRRHEIPLPDLAYYVLLQADGVAIVKGLLAGELPTKAEAGLLSDRIRLHLAALVYGADVEESHELLLRQPILDALEAADATRLDELARVSNQFWLVLELAVEQGCDEWTQNEGALVLHAAAALAGSSAVAADAARAAAQMRRLGAAVRAIAGWGAMDARAVDGAIALASGDPSLAPLLHDGFTRARLGDGSMAPAAAGEFARDYLRLTSALGATPAAPWRVADAATYVEIAKALAAADPDGATWSHLAPQDESAFTTAVVNPPRPSGWGDAVRVAVRAGLADWDLVISNAGAAFAPDADVPAAERLECLTAIHALANAGNEAADKLLNTVTDAYAAAANYGRDQDYSLPFALAAIGNHSSADAISAPDDPESLGAWLFTLLTRQLSSIALRRTRSSFGLPLEIAREWLEREYGRGAPEMAEILARATLRLGDAGRLLKLARQDTSYRVPADQMMVMQVLMALAAKGAPPRVLPPSIVVDEWEAAFPGWSRYDLARAMRTRRREIADMLTAIPFEARLAGAYAGVLDALTAGDDALQAFAASGLESLPADAWSASVVTGDGGLPLLHAALTRRGLAVVLRPEVTAVLRDFVIAPPDRPWMPADVAAAIMAAFDASERTAILDRVVTDLLVEVDRLSLNGRAEFPARAVSRAGHTRAVLAGRALFDPARVSAHPQAFPALVTLALDQPGDDWILWLQELTRAAPLLVERLPPHTRLALHKLVKDRVSRAADEALAALVALAGALAAPVQPGAAGVQTT